VLNCLEDVCRVVAPVLLLEDISGDISGRDLEEGRAQKPLIGNKKSSTELAFQ
jgi:hypothetical protein